MGHTLSQGATVAPAFAFTQHVMQTPTAAHPEYSDPDRSDDSCLFAFGTGAGGRGSEQIGSLAPRAPPALLSPPPAISSAQTNAGDPFCLDTESSTLLSIMDELEIAEDAAAEAQLLQDVEKGCAAQKAAILRDVPMAEDCAAAIAATLVALAVEAEMLQEGEEDPTELEPAEEEEALDACGHTHWLPSVARSSYKASKP